VSKRVDFVFFDAGGGHRSAANALKQVVEQQGRGWDVRLIHLQDVLASLDIFKKITGIGLQDIYNQMLARGWTLGSGFLVPWMHALIRLYHPAQVRLLTEFWRQEKPDLVVSVVPNFNRALFESVREALPAAPFVTILTDLADYPPHFWLEKQDQHVVCGSERAYRQALDIGIHAEKAFRVSGMILRPEFYQQPVFDRSAERRRLGLDPDKPAALMLFGGHGSNAMFRIARDLQSCGCELQLIVICGRNEELAARIRTIPATLRMHVVGFTNDVPFLMGLSDFFIGKPGPGSISEAIAMGLPVIVERNAWTLPQERYNADWVLEKNVGLVVDSFANIEQAVSELLEPPRFRELRANAAAIRNCAVFEIPDLLEKILGNS
jgi:UDP-N-acetylglucosamine:LPS N-acetylglucosamine transferase